ncbi:MAG: hypothetical protein NUW37_18505 [Planctomycetes bacterium]|nr:hypothetical protein [Planctomycetota bacterium]
MPGNNLEDSYNWLMEQRRLHAAEEKARMESERSSSNGSLDITRPISNLEDSYNWLMERRRKLGLIPNNSNCECREKNNVLKNDNNIAEYHLPFVTKAEQSRRSPWRENELSNENELTSRSSTDRNLQIRENGLDKVNVDEREAKATALPDRTRRSSQEVMRPIDRDSQLLRLEDDLQEFRQRALPEISSLDIMPIKIGDLRREDFNTRFIAELFGLLRNNLLLNSRGEPSITESSVKTKLNGKGGKTDSISEVITLLRSYPQSLAIKLPIRVNGKVVCVNVFKKADGKDGDPGRFMDSRPDAINGFSGVNGVGGCGVGLPENGEDGMQGEEASQDQTFLMDINFEGKAGEDGGDLNIEAKEDNCVYILIGGNGGNGGFGANGGNGGSGGNGGDGGNGGVADFDALNNQFLCAGGNGGAPGNGGNGGSAWDGGNGGDAGRGGIISISGSANNCFFLLVGGDAGRGGGGGNGGFGGAGGMSGNVGLGGAGNPIGFDGLVNGATSLGGLGGQGGEGGWGGRGGWGGSVVISASLFDNPSNYFVIQTGAGGKGGGAGIGGEGGKSGVGWARDRGGKLNRIDSVYPLHTRGAPPGSDGGGAIRRTFSRDDPNRNAGQPINDENTGSDQFPGDPQSPVGTTPENAGQTRRSGAAGVGGNSGFWQVR